MVGFSTPAPLVLLSEVLVSSFTLTELQQLVKALDLPNIVSSRDNHVKADCLTALAMLCACLAWPPQLGDIEHMFDAVFAVRIASWLAT